MSVLLVLSVLFFKLCSCDHILISAITASYGHWNSLLEISKEVLTRDNNNHFITFVIDENYAHYLDTITHHNKYNKESYQIIYTQSEHPIDFEKKFEGNNIRIRDGMIKYAAISFISKAVFLNHSESNIMSLNQLDGTYDTLQSVMNHNLKNKYNDISLLKFDKIDLCLLDAFNFFDISLCQKMFNIPTIITMVPAVISKAEYYHFRNTFIYFTDPFSLDFYSNMINGTVMSYKQKWINFITNAVYIITQKLTTFYIIIPILHEFNAIFVTLNINKSFDINSYNDGFTDFWDQTAIIGSLAPPFTPPFYQRSRVKQFGFLLHPSSIDEAINDIELLQWIERDNTPILLISMGSIHLLSGHIMQSIYKQLNEHNKNNQYGNYRILWALRQNIYENKRNDKLENDNFKIMEEVQQLQILKHSNIKLFMTHCGEGGIVESIYTKTLMILYPRVADQYMNGKRASELGLGLIIQDRDNLSDLTSIIDILLFDEIQSLYYQNQLNKVYKMISYHGGVSEAVDFIEYSVEFGTKHLLSTYGFNYNCDETIIPWYQQTMIDIYLIIASILIFVTTLIKKCLLDCLLNCKNKEKNKQKTQ